MSPAEFDDLFSKYRAARDRTRDAFDALEAYVKEHGMRGEKRIELALAAFDANQLRHSLIEEIRRYLISDVE